MSVSFFIILCSGTHLYLIYWFTTGVSVVDSRSNAELEESMFGTDKKHRSFPLGKEKEVEAPPGLPEKEEKVWNIMWESLFIILYSGTHRSLIVLLINWLVIFDSRSNAGLEEPMLGKDKKHRSFPFGEGEGGWRW